MKTILIYSGGMDSTTLLWHLLTRGDEVRCLSVNYGQRHKRELDIASLISGQAMKYWTNMGAHYIADLSHLSKLFAGSSQTSSDVPVPEGHYTDESMKLTVVPNRNMVMLSLAVAWAISTKSDAVAYAAHAGDHAIYPDCRQEFTDAMEEAIRLCDWHKVMLERPFVSMTKAQIALRGWDLRAPLELSYSCYKGGEKHCGRCGTCVERREAFSLAGIKDPTSYEE